MRWIQCIQSTRTRFDPRPIFVPMERIYKDIESLEDHLSGHELKGIRVEECAKPPLPPWWGAHEKAHQLRTQFLQAEGHA